MDKKSIDNIVWYIPLKKLRDAIRDYMLRDYKNCISPWDIDAIIDFRKSIRNDDNFIEKYKKLISNLDDESIKTINYILKYILEYKNIDDKVIFSDKESSILEKILEEHFFNIIKINDQCFIYDKYLLPSNHFNINVFYYKNGINNIKNLQKIKSKNIIDAGGYIGDSAIVLADYTDKKVYSFEPFKQHYEIMLKTINLNSNTNIIPVNMALGDKNKSLDIFSDGEIKGSHSLETTFSNENNSKNKIEMITLDQFVEEKNIEVGLIKTDLEGFEQPFLNGAINTIKKYKPVLLISIYHSYSDFFEIKPMIEALDLGYSFKILKIKEPSLIGETILIAEIE